MLGLFLARIRWFSDLNLDAIKTGAETTALKTTRNDSAGLNSEALSAFTSPFGVIRKICLPHLQVTYYKHNICRMTAKYASKTIKCSMI